MITGNEKFFIIFLLLYSFVLDTQIYAQPPNDQYQFRVNSSEANWSGAYPILTALKNGNVNISPEY